MTMSGSVRGMVVIGVLALLGACGGGSDAGTDVSALPSTEPTSSVAVLDGGVTVLMLDFDELEEGRLQPDEEIPDVSGNSNNGTFVVPEDVASVPAPRAFSQGEGEGLALKFRKPCNAGPNCIRGVIEVPSATELNPVVSDFTYGLDVRVVAEDIRTGGNLLQKGFSTGPGGQWKIQVDDKSGFPACVLVDSLDNEFLDVDSSVSVADGEWHSLVCERSGTELAIWVDGEEAGRVKTREVFLIDNPWPVRVAGKHVKQNGDFFFGDVDNVFLTVRG